MPSTRLLAYCSLLAAVFIWGANFAVVKVAANEWRHFNFTLLAVRFWIAYILYRVISALFPRVFAATPGTSLQFPWKPTVWVALCLACGYGFQTRYLTDGGPIKAAFLTSTTVLWAPLIAWLWKAKPAAATVLGALLAFLGIWMIEGSDVQSNIFLSALAVGAAIAFALEIILVSKFIPLTGVTEWTQRTTLVVAVIMTLLAVVFDLPLWPPPFSGKVALSIVFSAVMATAVALWLQNWSQAQVDGAGLRILDGPRVAILSAMEPVFTVLVSVLLLGQNEVDALGAIGCTLILAGNLVSEVVAARRKP